MFQLDPMQLAIGAIFEMCDFFLQINERKLLEFTLKCSILVFSIDTVASSSLSRSVAHFQKAYEREI